MPLISSQKGQHSHFEKVKHLYPVMDRPADPGAELIPFFCVEARIDFSDVRTGFRETVSLSRALEIYSSNADLLWTDDMIRDIDLLKMSSSAPEGVVLGALPEYVDQYFLTRMENQFVQYLLRSFQTRIYRNFELNLYSLAGESDADFRNRCLELFDNEKRQELDRLHDLFNRKLEQIRQKYLNAIDVVEIEDAKSESQNKDAFARCSERIGELFRKAELRMKLDAAPLAHPGTQEFEERLVALESEAYQAFGRICDLYNEKAGAIDEYILHPNLKDIHFVRSCIAWMQKGAA